ncbi:hypothetical protein [Trichococcus collinsii]|uniref:Uncharacterized protein n=1 Tax=Trichococcus collinsii TaxID=157076 RepID=A0AB37ZXI3_9LACT|nr:hypothetical protein [Trichococcus collinsii]CZR02849.1 Hypothetical protein Tcol_2087 [Trichococcus collinsii]SDZ97024.1 hypothetical protein SAMN04488525_101751 [Trichococcus collinsii]
MNELEKAIVDELEAAEHFKDFFIKVSIFQTNFDKRELKQLSSVITDQRFIDKYGWTALCFMVDNIHKERALPFNNVPEKTRLKKMLTEYAGEGGA